MTTKQVQSADFLWNIPGKTNDHRKVTILPRISQSQKRLNALVRWLCEKTGKDGKFFLAKVETAVSPQLKFTKLIAYAKTIGLNYR